MLTTLLFMLINVFMLQKETPGSYLIVIRTLLFFMKNARNKAIFYNFNSFSRKINPV